MITDIVKQSFEIACAEEHFVPIQCLALGHFGSFYMVFECQYGLFEFMITPNELRDSFNRSERSIVRQIRRRLNRWYGYAWQESLRKGERHE